MKKLLTLLFMLIPMLSWPQDLVKIDGIWYNIIEKARVAEVTNSSGTKYTGSITIPESVEYNGTTCSVTSIREWTFYDCEGLTSITIPNSVTSIGERACYDCSGLTSITIGNAVTSIGKWAFSYCSGLTSIVVEDGNTKYDSRDNCNCLIETATNTLLTGCKNSTIPNSVTSIGDYAFDSCSGLTSIDIPNSVTSIGNYAFDSCSGLTSIDIPNSVTNIGDWAFEDCM